MFQSREVQVKPQKIEKKKKTEKFHCDSKAILKMMPKVPKMETIIKYLWMNG